MFAETPPALLARLNKPQGKSDLAGLCLLANDSPSSIAAAVAAAQAAEPAVEGAGGDTHTIVVANAILDHVSPAVALEILLDHWDERCAPPWGPEDLEEKIANAASSRQNAIQCKAIEADFEPMAVDEITGGIVSEEEDDDALPIVHAPEAFANLAAAETIKGLMIRGSVALLYGAPNEGKTFLAMHMMAAVAKGEPWMGRKTRAGLCVHVAMEGEQGILKRYMALHRHQGASGVYVIPTLLTLTSEKAKDTRRLIASYRKLLDATGMAPGIICIDTVALAIGGDEDKSEIVSPFLKAMKRVAQDTGATVLLLHHPGKDESRGPRGSSGFVGNVDQSLYMKDGKIFTKKVRDGSKDQVMAFKLRVVEVGKDADGDPVTTCVVDEGGASVADDFDPPVDRLSPAARGAFDAVASAAAEIGKPEGEMVWLPRSVAADSVRKAKGIEKKRSTAGARAVDDLVKKEALARREGPRGVEVGVPADYVTPRAAAASHSGQGVGNAVH